MVHPLTISGINRWWRRLNVSAAATYVLKNITATGESALPGTGLAPQQHNRIVITDILMTSWNIGTPSTHDITVQIRNSTTTANIGWLVVIPATAVAQIHTISHRGIVLPLAANENVEVVVGGTVAAASIQMTVIGRIESAREALSTTYTGTTAAHPIP